MLDSKLLSILRKLNTRERSRFKEYVSSPFFNKHKGLIKLCEYILEYAPLFNHENLDQKAAFQELFPKQIYSEQLIYTLVSNLLELMNSFLSQLEFEENQLEQKRYTLLALRKRKESKQWYSVKKQYEIISSKKAEKDAAASLESKMFYDELNADFISKQLREEDQNLQLSSDLLDAYYIAEKLRLACDIKSRNLVIKANYNSFELDSIIKIVDKNFDKFIQFPAIVVYRDILRFFEDDKEIEYHKVVDTIKSNLNYFTVSEIKTQFDYAINFVIRKLNSGEPEWHRAFLELHRYLLENEILLRDGKLPEWDFKNIVTVALRANEIDWVEQFINEYKNWLPENVKENAYIYNMASFCMEAGRYRESMQLLQKVDFTDESYQLGAKIILLKSYYELGEYEAGKSLIQAFKRFVERSKTLSEYRQKSNLNMLKVAGRLYKFQFEFEYIGSAKIRRLKKAIKTDLDTLEPIANFDWLSEKYAKIDN
jgi:hypothetical protein